MPSSEQYVGMMMMNQIKIKRQSYFISLVFLQKNKRENVHLFIYSQALFPAQYYSTLDTPPPAGVQYFPVTQSGHFKGPAPKTGPLKAHKKATSAGRLVRLNAYPDSADSKGVKFFISEFRLRVLSVVDVPIGQQIRI